MPVFLAIVSLAGGVAAQGTALDVRDFGASGSAFETTGATRAGSAEVRVADVGDFQVGQHVSVSRCLVRYANPRLWGPGEPYSTSKALGDEAEFRGYDGSSGSWLVYLLEIDGVEPLTFRWSDDVARTWRGTKVPVTFDWQPLSGGVEVRFARREWQPGHMISVSARDQLVARIEKVEGNVLTLSAAANRDADDAVVRHCDGPAIQAAVDQAIRDRRHVVVPPGTYRLTGTVAVRSPASLRIEGAGPELTVMDISDGTGSVFALYGGGDVTIRGFRMVGHTGREERAGAFRTSSGYGFWASCLKSCNAVGIYGTERVLIEDVHASRMASECFYSQGPGRYGSDEPANYTKSITYLRCVVTDCAANAFNNNDVAENTSVLHCRIIGAGPGGWHSWEGPSRFIRFMDNYVRDSGPVTVGDMSHRHEHLNELGCGQAIVSGNVFEGSGGGIVVNHGSSQVVIENNLFVNYNGNAIRSSAQTVRTSYPSRHVIIRGNLIDLTYDGQDAVARTGIFVSTDDTIVADNQVYVRGSASTATRGIQVAEPALRVTVHDNLLRNLGVGFAAEPVQSKVTEVIDPTTFIENGLPLQWEVSHRYRGWHLLWLDGEPANAVSVIDEFDPKTLRFTLREPREMKVGDRFEVYPPDGADWRIHDNTIVGCLVPVTLRAHGGPTSIFEGNLIRRGEADGVRAAIAMRGQFTVERNRIHGFPEGQAIELFDDPLGRPIGEGVRENVIEP